MYTLAILVTSWSRFNLEIKFNFISYSPEKFIVSGPLVAFKKLETVVLCCVVSCCFFGVFGCFFFSILFCFVCALGQTVELVGTMVQRALDLFKHLYLTSLEPPLGLTCGSVRLRRL